jgi:hypothetical protein
VSHWLHSVLLAKAGCFEPLSSCLGQMSVILPSFLFLSGDPIPNSITKISSTWIPNPSNSVTTISITLTYISSIFVFSSLTIILDASLPQRVPKHYPRTAQNFSLIPTRPNFITSYLHAHHSLLFPCNATALPRWLVSLRCLACLMTEKRQRQPPHVSLVLSLPLLGPQ